MATLSRKSFEEYDRLLTSCEERSTKGFADKALPWAVGLRYAPNEQTRSIYRDALIDEVYGRIDVYRAEAQLYADELFEAITGYEPSEHEPFPFEAADARVRSAAVHLYRDDDLDEFLRMLEVFIKKEVRLAPKEAVAQDVEKANER